MTIAEIQVGVERSREQDATQADKIERWLARVIETMQVVPIGTEAAILWAKLMQGRSRSLAEDAWIAATARHHGYIVATRNIQDF